jgi:hypothetical protein
MVSLGSEGRNADHVTDCVELAESLSKNVKLLHLDMSHNNFSRYDIDVIGDGLIENHTLVGLHITGAMGTNYDTLGFLYCTPPGELEGDQENVEPGADQVNTVTNSRVVASNDHALQHFAKSVKYQESTPWLDLPHTSMRQGNSKHCWICESWSETRVLQKHFDRVSFL